MRFATPRLPGGALALVPDRQRATVEIALANRTAVRAEVSITNKGLLAIGALVTSILLSTAVIVGVARTGGRKPATLKR